MRPTIIIPTLGLPHLRECVDGLQRFTPAHDLLLVADIEPGLARSAFEHEYAGAHLIINDQRVGIAHAVNQGLLKTTGGVVIMNDDVFVKEGWLPPLLEALEQCPDLIPNATDCAENGDQHYMALLGCTLLSREALQAIGLFDEDPRFWYGGADYDYYIRAQRAGYQPVHVPESRVAHRVGLTVGKDNLTPERSSGVITALVAKYGYFLPDTVGATLLYPAAARCDGSILTPITGRGAPEVVWQRGASGGPTWSGAA